MATITDKHAALMFAHDVRRKLPADTLQAFRDAQGVGPDAERVWLTAADILRDGPMNFIPDVAGLATEDTRKLTPPNSIPEADETFLGALKVVITTLVQLKD